MLEGESLISHGLSGVSTFLGGLESSREGSESRGRSESDSESNHPSSGCL